MSYSVPTSHRRRNTMCWVFAAVYAVVWAGLCYGMAYLQARHQVGAAWLLFVLRAVFYPHAWLLEGTRFGAPSILDLTFLPTGLLALGLARSGAVALLAGYVLARAAVALRHGTVRQEVETEAQSLVMLLRRGCTWRCLLFVVGYAALPFSVPATRWAVAGRWFCDPSMFERLWLLYLPGWIMTLGPGACDGVVATSLFNAAFAYLVWCCIPQHLWPAEWWRKAPGKARRAVLVQSALLLALVWYPFSLAVTAFTDGSGLGASDAVLFGAVVLCVGLVGHGLTRAAAALGCGQGSGLFRRLMISGLLIALASVIVWIPIVLLEEALAWGAA